MRPAWSTLTLVLVIACASRIACQYDDSFEVGGSSAQEDEEDDSGSQELSDGDDMREDDEGGDESGTAGSGSRDEDDITTASYGNDEEKDGEESTDATTISRFQKHYGNYLPRRQFPVQSPEDPRKDAPPGGSPYINYRVGYSPYFGRYFNQLPQRFHLSDKPPYGLPESPMFSVPSHVSPDNRLTHGSPNDQYEVGRGKGAVDSIEDMPSEDQIPPGENFDYLRKLRNMVIMARLRKHYGLDMRPPLAPPQPVTITRVVSVAATLAPTEAPKTTAAPAAHNITQMMSEEMETLRSRLRTMELERVKLRTILIQLKSILNEMHERSNAFGAAYPTSLNMTQHEMRIARLRNLFLILRAVTKLTPLTTDEIEQINYDVGIFDPKITYDSKAALINRMADALRRRAHENGEDAFKRSDMPIEDTEHASKISAKSCQHSNGQAPAAQSLHFVASSGPPPSPATSTSSGDNADRRDIIACKLRRLRNLYLMVRPFVTGTKLTREELHEIFQSHEGFFEPGMSEIQKIELVSKMAETIRMAHVSRQLILNTSPSMTPTTTSAAATSTSAPTGAPPSSEALPASPFVRPPVLIITQRLSNDLSNRPAPPSDKMHVSGKIQMDLDIEGDVDPAQEGLLSKLL